MTAKKIALDMKTYHGYVTYSFRKFCPPLMLLWW